MRWRIIFVAFTSMLDNRTLITNFYDLISHLKLHLFTYHFLVLTSNLNSFREKVSFSLLQQPGTTHFKGKTVRVTQNILKQKCKACSPVVIGTPNSKSDLCNNSKWTFCKIIPTGNEDLSPNHYSQLMQNTNPFEMMGEKLLIPPTVAVIIFLSTNSLNFFLTR